MRVSLVPLLLGTVIVVSPALPSGALSLSCEHSGIKSISVQIIISFQCVVAVHDAVVVGEYQI